MYMIWTIFLIYYQKIIFFKFHSFSISVRYFKDSGLYTLYEVWEADDKEKQYVVFQNFFSWIIPKAWQNNLLFLRPKFSKFFEAGRFCFYSLFLSCSMFHDFILYVYWILMIFFFSLYRWIIYSWNPLQYLLIF